MVKGTEYTSSTDETLIHTAADNLRADDSYKPVTKYMQI